MIEDERAPHESGIYSLSLTPAHAQFRRDIRRSLENRAPIGWVVIAPRANPFSVCRGLSVAKTIRAVIVGAVLIG
jgi:hypothetical protein